MANEFFTTRSGRQVKVPVVTVPSVVLTSVMRLQEDLALKHQAWTISELVITLIDLGISARRNSMKYAEKTKQSKEVADYIRTQLEVHAPIDQDHLRKLMAKGTTKYVAPEIEFADENDVESTDLTDEQLEQATSPTGHVS
jgi:hypothetical protein